MGAKKKLSSKGEDESPKGSVLVDRARRPDEDDLAKLMGRAKAYWDAFVEEAARVCPGSKAEWKFYAGKTGWRCVVKDRKRNVAYLRPEKGGFLVSLAFCDDAVLAAGEADLPESLVRSMEESAKLPEGRAVRWEVKSSSDLGVAKVLVGIKART